MASFDLKWMIGRSIGQVTFTEPHYWLFQFTTGETISVECHWRVLEGGQIVVSDEDHRQRFGLAEPVDAAEVASKSISLQTITNVELREGTADLLLSFTDDRQLQIIPFSSGYESWQTRDSAGNCIIAQGRGQLSFWKS